METRNRFFIVHFVYCILLFICILSSTVSDYWSLSKNAFHGLFKSCHIVRKCSDRYQTNAVYRTIQFLQIISCISAISGVVYCFISILLRRYIQNKMHFLAFFYATQTVCGCGSLMMYILLVYNKMKLPEKRHGWALYVVVISTVLNFIGLLFSFVLIKQQQKSPVIVQMEERELKYHHKSLNQNK